MGVLTEILEKGVRPKVNMTDYTWVQVYGLQELLKYHAERTKVGEVELVKDYDDYRYDPKNEPSVFSSWGDSYDYTNEALLYDDGTILAAVTVSTWNGTFATHHSISVKYYVMTPKVEVKKKSKTKKKK